MKAIGFDVSSKRVHYACVVRSAGVVDSASVAEDEQGRKMTGVIKDSLHLFNLLKTFEPDIIAIERIPHCKSHQTTVILCEAVGRFQQRVHSLGLEYRMVAVSEWNKATMGPGKGNANKEELKRWAIKQGLLPAGLDQDCYDACLIALSVLN
jgi:Holliday junction resolvasome RuvABC endonuclease subunit